MYYEIKDVFDAVLRDYAIDGVLKDLGCSWGNIVDDELIFLVQFDERTLKHVVSVDNRKCFNKTSQCPIHFNLLNLSRRKKNRLHQALSFLRATDGAKNSATFNWRSWEEFGERVRGEFYQD